jgi:hypothetical protein
MARYATLQYLRSKAFGKVSGTTSRIARLRWRINGARCLRKICRHEKDVMEEATVEGTWGNYVIIV